MNSTVKMAWELGSYDGFPKVTLRRRFQDGSLSSALFYIQGFSRVITEGYVVRLSSRHEMLDGLNDKGLACNTPAEMAAAVTDAMGMVESLLADELGQVLTPCTFGF